MGLFVEISMRFGRAVIVTFFFVLGRVRFALQGLKNLCFSLEVTYTIGISTLGCLIFMSVNC